ncbi:MAG: hypothetical protein CMJ83_01440 [Planctomycetes bacterium]|nr:hypothetical protein [Planctomycetota bacterium]
METRSDISTPGAYLDTPGETEWLIAAESGNYALGTASGTASRRYHGWLVVALPPPLGRVMVWPRVEEILRVDDVDTALGRAWWAPDVLAPADAGQLVSFARDPEPTWIIEAAGRTVRRRFRMSADGRQAFLLWDLVEGPHAELLVRPLLTWRSHHYQTRAPKIDPRVEIGFSGRVADATQHVYRDALSPVERARGYDHVEDLCAPMQLAFDLVADSESSAWLGVGVGESPATPPDRPESAPDPRDAYVIRHPSDDSPGIIAGYPWFTEWGRDTMIALPGLLLPHRAGVAAEVLRAWAARADRGLLPNQLRDLGDGPLATNTADAPLRFVRAVGELRAVAPERIDDIIRRGVDGILDGYAAGTDHGIHVDDDGLVAAGDDVHALTWMDAIAPGGPVTPRRGKPIDIAALWVEALAVGRALAEDLGGKERGSWCEQQAARARDGLLMRFVDPVTGDLLDVVDAHDPAEESPLRPNLLLALALDPSPFPRDVREHNLARVEARLLTPYGLRTLDPGHPDYVGRYGGDQATRDRAYHQGTVWPWLIGPYADAVRAVRGDDAVSALRTVFAPVLRELAERGAIHEVYDGDAPHRPGGCPAQAWSVAEVVRTIAPELAR